MIWISRFSLIVYLVGGWLLPAAHHHVHSHQQSHDEELVVSECGCSGHSDVTKQAEDESAKDSSLQWVTGSHLDACDGLCALCTARSLTSTTIRGNSGSFDSSPVLNLKPVEPDFRPNWICSVHNSRGPPTIV